MGTKPWIWTWTGASTVDRPGDLLGERLAPSTDWSRLFRDYPFWFYFIDVERTSSGDGFVPTPWSALVDLVPFKIGLLLRFLKLPFRLGLELFRLYLDIFESSRTSIWLSSSPATDFLGAKFSGPLYLSKQCESISICVGSTSSSLSTSSYSRSGWKW